MYIIHYSSNKNIAYVWRGIKTNLSTKNSTAPGPLIVMPVKMQDQGFIHYKIGLNSFQLSPVISTKIWKRVVLPSVLYACELWTSLSNEDIRNLEYIQRHFQGLLRDFPNIRQLSPVCLILTGNINTCRLIFYGRLLRTDQMFIHSRVFHFIAKTDVYKFFSKYCKFV